MSKRKSRNHNILKRTIRLSAAAGIALFMIAYLSVKLIPTDGASGILNALMLPFIPPTCFILFLIVSGWLWLDYDFYVKSGGHHFKGVRFDRNTNMTRKQLLDYYRKADPHKLDVSTLPNGKWYTSGGLVLGHVGDRLIDVPPGSQVNVALMGKPKSGKSVMITDSILSILYAGSQTSFCAVDLKGDLVSAVKAFSVKMRSTGKRINPYKVFSPTDPEHSVHFDPLFQVRGKTLDQAKPVIRAIAEMLIPLPADTGSNSAYFAEVAQNFFCGSCLYLLDRKPAITFPEIVANILNHTFRFWVKASLEDETPREVAEFLRLYKDENEVNVGGGYGALSRALQDYSTEALRQLLVPADDALSVKDLENGTNIFLRVSQKEMDQYGRLLGLIFDLFILELLDRPEMRDAPYQREIWLILDEFARLGRLGSVSTAIATTRSKGVTLLLGFQSLAPLQKPNMYGEKGTDEILDCCSIFGITQVTSPKSQEWCSKLVGDHLVLKTSYGNATGKDASDQTVTTRAEHEPVFRPEDFGDPKEFGEEGKLKVVIVKDGKYVKADIVKHWEDEPL